MRNALFYLLSFTWGLVLTLIGCVVASVLILAGHRPKRYGCCLLFEVGDGWGGVSLGPVILIDRNEPESTKAHEHGHAIQNIVYGPFVIFLVCIPSAVRYWYRRVYQKAKHAQPLPPYDSVWFEVQATRWGRRFADIP